MTRGSIITDLKALIGRGNNVSDGQLSVWINDAYMQVVDEIQKANPDYFVKSATSSSVNGQQEYELPADFDMLMMVNIQIDSTWRRPLPLQGIDQVANHSNATGCSWGNPKYYLIGEYIGFLPIPAETTTDNIKVWYSHNPSEMTLDADVPAFPSKFHHILKYSAYALFLDQDDEHVAAEAMRRRFETYLAKLVESIGMCQWFETKQLKD